MSCLPCRSEASIRSYSARLSEEKKREISDHLTDGIQKKRQKASPDVVTSNVLDLTESAPVASCSAAPTLPVLDVPSVVQQAVVQPAVKSVVQAAPVPGDDWDQDVLDDALMQSAMSLDIGARRNYSSFAPVFHNCTNITINFGHQSST